jgi:hypothetical protein
MAKEVRGSVELTEGKRIHFARTMSFVNLESLRKFKGCATRALLSVLHLCPIRMQSAFVFTAFQPNSNCRDQLALNH